MRQPLIKALAAIALTVATATTAAQPVAKIRVFANGSFEVNGRKVSPAALDEALRAHAAQSGVVWYYRENPLAEPHPNADIVVQTIIRHRLPVSMSTKPDFSDYVDENRVSRPRK